ncbi:MAG: hypothetical protein WAW96_03200 [Alphaproteobacteria bacterium]
MRALTTGSWYTLKLAFTLIALVAIALPLAHFNATMREAFGGGLWDQFVAGLSRVEDLIALPIARLAHINPGSELYLWIKALIPIDAAVLLWILPDPRRRDVEMPSSAPEAGA